MSAAPFPSPTSATPSRPAERLRGARDAQAARGQGLRDAQRIGPRVPLQPGGFRHRRQEIGAERNRHDVFFNGSPASAASALLGMSEQLETDELKELEEMIAKARKAKGGK